MRRSTPAYGAEVSSVSTLKCDECGKLRVNDSNHWLEGTISTLVSDFTPCLIITLAGKQSGHRIPANLAHFCGQACALKWLAAKIGEL